MGNILGLYQMSKAIARRGIGSPLSNSEGRIEVGSSVLEIHNSDVAPYRYMTLGLMADFLYGLSMEVWRSSWFHEAEIDIYIGSGPKVYHVGHGWLTNRGTPPAGNSATA